MKEPASLSHGVSESTGALVDEWQSVVDIMAELMAVPAGLIMRCQGDDIEVLVASASPGNPYHPGDKEHLADSGLYCETVIKTRKMLMVPNALQDEKWRTNPDIKLGMISYLGYPIFLPQGEVFGTICVLDIKENFYSETYNKMLLQLKNLIEAHLELMHTNCLLHAALQEVKTLEGLLPICAHCKKIRDEHGDWQPLEYYISQRSQAKFSHGICPDCILAHYREQT